MIEPGLMCDILGGLICITVAALWIVGLCIVFGEEEESE